MKFCSATSALLFLFVPATASADVPAPPRVVVAWPNGPLEVRVAFDRPLDPAVTAGLAGASIPFVDPRRSVQAHGVGPDAGPLATLKVAVAGLTDDRRTLILATDPHPFRASYRAILPGIRGVGDSGPNATVAAAYDLSGVLAEFQADEKESRSGSIWWPSLDIDAVRDLTRGSAEHERFEGRLVTSGRLTLRTMLTLPMGKVAVRLRSSGTLEEPTLGGETAQVTSVDGGSVVVLKVESTGEPIELAMDIRTAASEKPFVLHASFVGEGDPPIPRDRLALPWAPAAPPQSSAATTLPAEMAGGDAKRGEAVFFSEQAKCSVCHAIRGKGGNVGPDLANVATKGAATVYRDILEPSAAIHPDYVPYTVSTKDGRVVAGIVRSEGADAIKVINADAQATVVKRSEIEEIRPSATSIMPVGLPGAIGGANMRDLMAYLTGMTKPIEGDKR